MTAGTGVPEELDEHFTVVAEELAEGGVIPFLGAGANLCARPEDVHWSDGQSEYLPNAYELGLYLAKRFRYPAREEPELERVAGDLARVSQYVSVERGWTRLYTELHKIFSGARAPSPLHRFLAQLPGVLRGKSSPAPYQLIVTTNYDDALETAYQDEGEPFDLVWYVAKGEDSGKFMHQPPEGEPVRIERPNECIDLAPEERSVILKIHGDVARLVSGRPVEDSFVITEDDYIEYLTHGANPTALIPLGLLNRMKEDAFLFLGYSLRDWNLRAILYRLWREQKLGSRSWAIQKNPLSFERNFWREWKVDVLDVDLEEYVRRLRTTLEGL